MTEKLDPSALNSRRCSRAIDKHGDLLAPCLNPTQVLPRHAMSAEQRLATVLEPDEILPRDADPALLGR